MYVNAMSIKNHVHFPYKYISELYSSVSVCAFVKDTFKIWYLPQIYNSRIVKI